MFYKKQQLNGKWYPRTVTQETIGTDQIARQLSREASVTQGDTYAVLVGLGAILSEHLAFGRRVKLKGIGTFYLTGKANGRGVDTPEEVTPKQITELRVRFIPEYRRTSTNQVTDRTIVPEKVQWTELD